MHNKTYKQQSAPIQDNHAISNSPITMPRWSLLWNILLLLLVIVVAEPIAKEYKENEKIVVWANKIGPYNSPAESQDFYEVCPSIRE